MKKYRQLSFLRAAAAALAFTCWPSPTILAGAQGLSAADRERLQRAEQAADRFVQRFRETLDFGVVWKEFRAAKVGSVMRSAITGESNAKFQKEVDEVQVERGFVSLMNYVYLKKLYDLSVAKIGSNKSDEELTPAEIREVEEANKYIKTNGAEPSSVKELEEYIAEADNLARLYRKYVSRNSFRSAVYKENLRYLSTFYPQGKDRHRIVEVDKGSGLGAGVKEYRVTRGAFHYAFIEERGEMKLMGIGMGN